MTDNTSPPATEPRKKHKSASTRRRDRERLLRHREKVREAREYAERFAGKPKGGKRDV
ncbi:MAG: hypothetical protein WCL04_05105 [Verrucomicrobiota bacterium]